MGGKPNCDDGLMFAIMRSRQLDSVGFSTRIGDGSRTMKMRQRVGHLRGVANARRFQDGDELDFWISNRLRDAALASAQRCQRAS